jgi:nucleoside-diphosphate-sugar epimerase
MGGSNVLPLTYVDNCAEAIAVAGAAPEAVGGAFNVLDDDLVTARKFLRLYKKNVARVRSVFLPYPVVLVLSYFVQWYHRHSQGQLPAVLTPYRVASAWRRVRFDNSKLKSIGWKQRVPTTEALPYRVPSGTCCRCAPTIRDHQPRLLRSFDLEDS